MMNTTMGDIPIELEQGELVTRYAEWSDLAIRYVRLPAGTDMAPVLAGLPNDRCCSPHWGLVLEGSIHVEQADGSTEKATAGDAFYWPSGHTAWTNEQVVFVEFGPVPQMRQFHDHAKAKLAA